MPDGGRRLRNVTATRAIRAFERLGYHLVRTKGSHHRLEHPERQPIVIPVHRGTVKVGIIVDALKKANISVDEFERAL